MSRLSTSDLAYAVYELVLAVLAAIFTIRIFCDYNWSLSALYGVSTVGSFLLGQGIVAALQRRNQAQRRTVQQENDAFRGH